MKLSDSKKKWCIVTGIGFMCIILVIAIVSRFKTETLVEAEATTAALKTTTDSPTISTQRVTGEETTTPVTTQEVSVQPITSTEAGIQNMDTGDSSGTEQSIQPEVTKPAEPIEEAKKDPTKTPSGEKVTTAVQAEENKVQSTTAPTQSPSESENNHEGEIYVPGFGWVEDNGGGVSQETIEDMYENGNKIGSMD
ncbi:DUF6550 family protein [Clostridium boliviensis]|uniref:DUF6550 family protein n=1 Tax=Clostridium boliviensis TaxID=318465 RepID=A0ABU4GJ16_9CLOT|nr:DUF6550 family protein [Clostridium boliviensis]MDW2797613.1 DUF6550 family protein [Clostridium boliviensis]